MARSIGGTGFVRCTGVVRYSESPLLEVSLYTLGVMQGIFGASLTSHCVAHTQRSTRSVARIWRKGVLARVLRAILLATPTNFPKKFKVRQH